MPLGLNRIRKLLVSDIFTPEGGVSPGQEHTVLVMGTEFGARLHTPDKALSNGGRLIQHIADRLGVVALGYVRPGLGGDQNARDILDLRTALTVANGNYDQTAYDIGRVLKDRLIAHSPSLTWPVLTCRSGAASFSASLARHNTIGAVSAVLLEPAGLHRFTRPFPALKAMRAMRRYQRQVESQHIKPEKPINEQTYAEPVLRRLQRIDMLLYADMASSAQTKIDLMHVRIPTMVELGEYGLYSQLADPHDLARDIDAANPTARILTHVREGATHSWYDASDNHSEAIAHGFNWLFAHFQGTPPPFLINNQPWR